MIYTWCQSLIRILIDETQIRLGDQDKSCLDECHYNSWGPYTNYIIMLLAQMSL